MGLNNYQYYPPIMENQMEKKLGNDMETGEYRDLRHLVSW